MSYEDLKSKSEVNLTSTQIYLLDSASEGDFEGVEKALGAGVDINVKDKDGYTPLMCAIVGDIDFEVIQLLIYNGANVNIKRGDGLTALEIYTERIGFDPRIIKLLTPKKK